MLDKIFDFEKIELSEKKINLQLLFLMIFIILALLYINENFKYENYLILNGTMIDKNKIVLLVEAEDLRTVKQNKSFNIKGKKFNYKIETISDTKIQAVGKQYNELFLKVEEEIELDEFLELSFYLSKERILNKILKEILEVNWKL